MKLNIQFVGLLKKIVMLKNMYFSEADKVLK
jgi:hypothetical protein